MPEWKTETVEGCLVRLTLAAIPKLQTQGYRPSGLYPIIDQGQTLIAGWTDDNSGLITQNLPVVVFGDHTRAFKFVDFPFVRGADGTQVLKPKAGIDPLYFYYALRAIDLPSRGYNRHLKALKEKEIGLPAEPEQLDIGRVLKLVEDAIGLQDEELQAWDRSKRAAMQMLFICGLRGETQKETDIGPVPESWDTKRLGEYFHIKHGFAFDGSMFRSTGKYILLTPGHFFEEGGFRDQGEKTKYFVGAFDQQYLLKSGDLLVAMTEQKPGLLGSAAFIPSEGLYLHNQRLGVIGDLRKDDLDPRYLYHILNYQPVRDAISKTSTGSKVKHTSPDRIRAVVAPVPPLDQQIEIAEVIDAVDRKIGLHKRKRVVLDELFKSLLQKLMTGEIRTGDLDLSALDPHKVAA
jgi:type I restriction enzyme S subunit